MGHADQVGNLLMKSKYMRHLNCSICAGSLGGWEVDEYHIQTDVLQHVRAFNVCRLWRFQPKVTHRKTDVQLSTGRRVLEGARFDLEVETQHFILCFVLFPAQKDMLLSNQKGSKRLSHVIHAAMLIFQISECNQWETCRTQLNCTEAVMLMSTHSLNDTDAPSHSLVTPFLLPRPSPESIQQLPPLPGQWWRAKSAASAQEVPPFTPKIQITLIYWKMYMKFGQQSLSSPSHINVPKIKCISRNEPVHMLTLKATFPTLQFLLTSAEIPPEPSELHSKTKTITKTKMHLNCQQTLKSPNIPTERSQSQGCWWGFQCVYETYVWVQWYDE